MSKQSVFISYAGADREWAQWLRARLRRSGFDVLTDSSSVDPGASFFSELHRTISESGVVLALLSPNFFQSAWCQQETAAAAASQIPIIPVMIERCEVQGFLKHYNWADLTTNREAGLRDVIRAAEELPAQRPV